MNIGISGLYYNISSLKAEEKEILFSPIISISLLAFKYHQQAFVFTTLSCTTLITFFAINLLKCYHSAGFERAIGIKRKVRSFNLIRRISIAATIVFAHQLTKVAIVSAIVMGIATGILLIRRNNY
ncbi:MAG: hypothetical protein Tsb0021_03360 [Chlamydiales bacterium]